MMKIATSLLAAIATVAFVAAQHAALADALVDSETSIGLDCSTSFEGGGPDGWYEDRIFSLAVSWSATSSLSNMGSLSATVEGTNGRRHDFLEFGSEIDSESITSFDIPEVSFSVIHPIPDATKLLSTAFNDDGSQASTTLRKTMIDWESFDTTAFVNANSGGAVISGISFFGNNGGATYLDDIAITGSAEIERVPEPSRAVLVCAVGAAILGRRRRVGD